MLARFLILVGVSTTDHEQRADYSSQATGLCVCFRHPGCTVLASRAEDILNLPDGMGCVIGTLFPRHGPARPIAQHDPHWLDEFRNGDIVTVLRDRFWGSYVSLVLNDMGTAVLRDPSGAMPCYRIDIENGWAFASDVSLLVEAGLLKPAIAWSQIPRYLAAKDLPSVSTALDKVDEILPGTVLWMQAGSCTLVGYWSPWDHVPTGGGNNLVQEGERLRRTIDHCTASWASSTAMPLVTLSGGLDSSIVAAALNVSGQTFSAVTISTGGLGDERAYARAMAEAAGCELTEADYDLAHVDLSKSAAHHFPKPIGHVHELAFHAAAMEAAVRTGASAIFTGNGGDSVFYNSSSLRPVIDCIRAEGLTIRALRALRSVAAITEVSPSGIALGVMKQWRQVHRPYDWRLNLDLMTQDAVKAIAGEKLQHPWLEAKAGRSPGKTGHIALLLRVQNHLEGYFRPYGMALINPLISQPVTELMLSVQTWLMVEGGRDRAIARHAYADRLPAIVRERRRKGSPSAFAIDLMIKKRKEVQERLMDGELVSRGYIDRTSLAAALSQDPAVGQAYVRIMALLDMEAWIAHWQKHGV